jgi:hypothetical protein
MTFSNVVMFAIIVATAQTLHAHNETNIQSAAQAAEALKPFAGHFASALFALGSIGSGLLAVPVLAGSGSVGMAGLLGHEWGFSRSVRDAPVFYGLVALGTLGGTVLSLLHVNPIHLLVLMAVINGVAAAPFLVVVMWVSSSRQLIGEYVNGRAAKILGWTTVAVRVVAAVAMFATGCVSFRATHRSALPLASITRATSAAGNPWMQQKKSVIRYSECVSTTGSCYPKNEATRRPRSTRVGQEALRGPKATMLSSLWRVPRISLA